MPASVGMTADLAQARQKRPPLPTRDQIDAVTDVDALLEIEERLVEQRKQVEVDLEYRSAGDLEWEGRARGFLTAVRVAEAVVKKRIHRLRTAKDATCLSPADQVRKAETKATTRLAHEQAAKNALDRKAREQEASRLHEMRLNRRLVERLSYLHHFHTFAHQLLGEDACRQVSAAASQATATAAAEILPQGEPL